MRGRAREEQGGGGDGRQKKRKLSHFWEKNEEKIIANMLVHVQFINFIFMEAPKITQFATRFQIKTR